MGRGNILHSKRQLYEWQKIFQKYSLGKPASWMNQRTIKSVPEHKPHTKFSFLLLNTTQWTPWKVRPAIFPAPCGRPQVYDTLLARLSGESRLVSEEAKQLLSFAWIHFTVLFIPRATIAKNQILCKAISPDDFFESQWLLKIVCLISFLLVPWVQDVMGFGQQPDSFRESSLSDLCG